MVKTIRLGPCKLYIGDMTVGLPVEEVTVTLREGEELEADNQRRLAKLQEEEEKRVRMRASL